jgi:hypothetical protein
VRDEPAAQFVATPLSFHQHIVVATYAVHLETGGNEGLADRPAEAPARTGDQCPLAHSSGHENVGS